MAVNCPATPRANSASPGVTAIDTTATFVRLNAATPDTPLASATTV